MHSDCQYTELGQEFPGPETAEQITEDASPTSIGAHLISDPTGLHGLSETCHNTGMSESLQLRNDLRAEEHSSSDLERSSNCRSQEDIIPATPSLALSSPPLVLPTCSEVDTAPTTQPEEAQETPSAVFLERPPNKSYSPSPAGAGDADIYMLPSLSAASEGQLENASEGPQNTSFIGDVKDATMDLAPGGGTLICDRAVKEEGEKPSVSPDTADISYPVCCDEDLHLRDALGNGDATPDLLPVAAGASRTAGDMNVSRASSCKEREHPSTIEPTPSVDLACVMSAPASPIDMGDIMTAPGPLAAPVPSAVIRFDFSSTPGDDSATEAHSGLVSSDSIPAPLLDQAQTSAFSCFEQYAHPAGPVPHIIVTPATPQISSALLYESSESSSARLVPHLTICNSTLLSSSSAISRDFPVLEANSASADGPGSDAVLGPFTTKTNDEDLILSGWSDSLDTPLRSPNSRSSVDEDELDSGPIYEHSRRPMITSGLAPHAVSHCSSNPSLQTPGVEEVKDEHAEHVATEDTVVTGITASDEDVMNDSLPSSSPPSSSQPASIHAVLPGENILIVDQRRAERLHKLPELSLL